MQPVAYFRNSQFLTDGGEFPSDCIFLIASMKLSVNCSLCRDLSVKGLRMLVK